jgi:hypothetical protein
LQLEEATSEGNATMASFTISPGKKPPAVAIYAARRPEEVGCSAGVRATLGGSPGALDGLDGIYELLTSEGYVDHR